MHNDDTVLESQPEDTPRCLDCAYCLFGLTEARCPECGRPFQLADPSTYSLRPPLIRWRLWLPGLVLAIGLGVSIFLILFLADWEVGWAATLATPTSIGAILGYRCRVKPLAYVLLALSAMAGILGTLTSAGVIGLICMASALCLMFGPTIAGALLGKLLRMRLKNSRFSQRSYLPLLFLFFLPIALAVAEGLIGSDPVQTSVQTSRVFEQPVDRVWRSLRYFDELTGTQPLLFRLGGLQPVGTDGVLTESGDIQVCKYRTGSVTKRLRSKEDGRMIAFDVIEQDIGFDRSVRLTGGSFRLATLGPARTRLSLRTNYEALLRPRVCWAPFEGYVLRTLHNYILDGIEREASSSARMSSTIAQLSHDDL